MIIHKRSSFLILGQNSFLFFSSPDVGYVQGMNDVLSRFLIVLGSEAQAYWCFTNYMETVKRDFLDDGMLDKISKFVILSHCCLCPYLLDLMFFFVFGFLVVFIYLYLLAKYSVENVKERKSGTTKYDSYADAHQKCTTKWFLQENVFYFAFPSFTLRFLLLMFF